MFIIPQGLGACAYPHDNPRASDTVVILVTHDREGKRAVIPYQFHQFLVEHGPNGINYGKYVDFKAMRDDHFLKSAFLLLVRMGWGLLELTDVLRGKLELKFCKFIT